MIVSDERWGSLHDIQELHPRLRPSQIAGYAQVIYALILYRVCILLR